MPFHDDMTDGVELSTEFRGLNETLERAFIGPFSHLHGLFQLRPPAQTDMSIDEVLTEPRLDSIVASFCREYGETPRLAVLSIWSKWYFATVLPPLLSANALLDLMLQSGLQQVRLVLADDGKIGTSVITAGRRVAMLPGAEQRLAPLVDNLVAPFIDLYHRRTRVSRRVLWSNAGNLVEGVVRHLEKHGAPSLAIAECDHFLSLARRADGTRNRLYRPVFYIDCNGERLRRRRVCCLRYLLPDGKLCCACPRLECENLQSNLPRELQ